MNRQQIFDYAEEQYETTPEYLWMQYPSYAVLRHRDNKKWYGVMMNVPKNKLGLPGTDTVDILDVKCEPMTIDFFRRLPGFFPGYHMNKTSWLSILLDGTVSDNHIRELLDMSFELTANKKKR